MTWAIKEKDYSQRRACELVGLAPETYRYVSQRPDDSEVRVRLRTLANERRRFGYPRLHLLLAREGHRLNHKNRSASTGRNAGACVGGDVVSARSARGRRWHCRGD